MEWTNLLVIGIFVVACLGAVYEYLTKDWDTRQIIGTIVFLIGAGIGLILDDFLPSDSTLLPWIEPIAAIIILAGALVSWLGQSD